MTLKKAFPEFKLEDKVSFKGNSGNKEKGHVGSNERKWCRTRAKITNSKLTNFEWSKH